MDQESILKLERDLNAKNEQTAKMMKEQEMLKNQLQYQNSTSSLNPLSLLNSGQHPNPQPQQKTVYPQSMINSFGHKLTTNTTNTTTATTSEKPIVQQSAKVSSGLAAKDESVFKVPPPPAASKFIKKGPCENTPMFTPKNAHPVGVKPLTSPKVALGESTNQMSSYSN